MDRVIGDRRSGRLFRPISIPITHPWGGGGLGVGPGHPQPALAGMPKAPNNFTFLPTGVVQQQRVFKSFDIWYVFICQVCVVTFFWDDVFLNKNRMFFYVVVLEPC